MARVPLLHASPICVIRPFHGRAGFSVPSNLTLAQKEKAPLDPAASAELIDTNAGIMSICPASLTM